MRRQLFLGALGIHGKFLRRGGTCSESGHAANQRGVLSRNAPRHYTCPTEVGRVCVVILAG